MYLVYSATVNEDTLKVCGKMKLKHNFSAIQKCCEIYAYFSCDTHFP